MSGGRRSCGPHEIHLGLDLVSVSTTTTDVPQEVLDGVNLYKNGHDSVLIK
jgi:hypothetical protein